MPKPATGAPGYLLTAACLVIVVAGLKAAASIFVPFALAFFFAVLSFPLLFELKRRRVPTVLAIAFTMLVVIGVVGVFGLFVKASFDGVARAAPRYQARFQALVDPLLERLDATGLEASEWLGRTLDLGQLVNVVRNTALGVATAVSFLFLVLLIMVFIQAEAVGFQRKLQRALGRDTDVLARFSKITTEVQQYLIIKTGVSLTTGVAVGLAVAVIGLDFPLFWGFLAFILNYVPNIGSVVAGVPAVLLALVQLGPARAIVTALVYVGVNVLLGNLVEPNLLGRRLRLAPLAVLLSLLFWGWVWGPVGMLLAVPLTMVAKIMVENIEGMRWLSVLLDASPRRGAPRRATEGVGENPVTIAPPAPEAPPVAGVHAPRDG